MSRRSSLTVLAVLAASGALIAGCSSSSPSSSSTPTASAPATSASAPASSTAASSSTKPSAADCTTLNSISSGVITTLAPLQSEPQAKAAVALKAYIAKLTADEATLTSPAGKAALGSFVTALGKSTTETSAQATTTVTAAIGTLSSACA